MLSMGVSALSLNPTPSGGSGAGPVSVGVFVSYLGGILLVVARLEFVVVTALTGTESLVGDPVWLSDREVLSGYVERRRRINRLEAEATRWLGEIDRRRAFETDGHVSSTAWVAAGVGDSPGAAAARVRVARRIESMPAVREAFEAGDIDLFRVQMLVNASRVDEDLFGRDEQTLVEAACTLSIDHLKRVLAYWRQAADMREAQAGADNLYRRRRLSVSATLGGMVRLDGDLDPEAGEIVITALRAVTDPDNLNPSDGRTAPQRRADALVDICRGHLDHRDTAVTGGEKPHVTLTVSIEALEGHAGRPCELTETGVITPQAARRLACDAAVTPMITNNLGAPIDIGRRTRSIPPAIRRALTARDGGCTAPGCGRPARWTDAHHIVHWADGGPTNLTNLTLLCRQHHRQAHEGAFQLPKRE